MNNKSEGKLIFPGLAGFYESWRDIAYTLVRVTIGYIMFMHKGTSAVAAPSGERRCIGVGYLDRL
jgi:hypothetical protein